MSSKNIRNLVRKAQNGDVEAFGELYEIYAKDMFRFAWYYTGTEAAAEDCVSEAALAAFQKITELRKAEAFKSWLFKILFNCCKKSQKAKIIQLNNEQTVDENESSYDESEKIDSIALKKAMEKLDEQEREILILYYSCGYTSKEIGDITGLNQSTVRSKISRSTAKMRTFLSL